MISLIAGFLMLPQGSSAQKILLVGQGCEQLSSKILTYLPSVKFCDASDGDAPFAVLTRAFVHDDARFVVLLPGLGKKWSERRDGFVKDLENSVTFFKNLKSHPKVLIATPLPGTGREGLLISEEVEPLTRQAARETGTALFETGDVLAGSPGSVESGVLSPDAAGLLADQLAQALDPKSVKSHWRVLEFSSQQVDEGPATAAIDGDAATYWHTQYDPKEAKPPHFLTIDFGAPMKLVGMTYLPRQDGGINGIAKGYEVYVGDSVTDFGPPVAVGKFPAGSGLKIVRWPSVAVGRFMKFVITSEQSGGHYGSAAEISVLRLPNK